MIKAVRVSKISFHVHDELHTLEICPNVSHNYQRRLHWIWRQQLEKVFGFDSGHIHLNETRQNLTNSGWRRSGISTGTGIVDRGYVWRIVIDRGQEIALIVTLASGPVMRQKFRLIFGKVVCIQGERELLETTEPLDAVFGVQTKFLDVLLEESPAESRKFSKGPTSSRKYYVTRRGPREYPARSS